MNKDITIGFNSIQKKVILVLIAIVMSFVGLALIQDYINSELKQSAYYFSESFLFSSFWWLLAPILYLQYYVVNQLTVRKLYPFFFIVLLPILLHLVAFPFLVWLISKNYYYHTFVFRQTLNYTLSTHFQFLIFIYSVPVLVYTFFTSKSKNIEIRNQVHAEGKPTQFIETIMVSEKNKNQIITVDDILYFTSNSPYINIHLQDRKYLFSETLKSISCKLNPEIFVRIHKSTLININMVASYTSRLNGDYDLIMKDNTKLRISRNFASDFKTNFIKTNRFKAK